MILSLADDMAARFLFAPQPVTAAFNGTGEGGNSAPAEAFTVGDFLPEDSGG